MTGRDQNQEPDSLTEARTRKPNPPQVWGCLDKVLTAPMLVFKQRETDNKHLHMCIENIQASKGIGGTGGVALHQEVREGLSEVQGI